MILREQKGSPLTGEFIRGSIDTNNVGLKQEATRIPYTTFHS
jgi:hypothetical protein